MRNYGRENDPERVVFNALRHMMPPSVATTIAKHSVNALRAEDMLKPPLPNPDTIDWSKVSPEDFCA